MKYQQTIIFLLLLTLSYVPTQAQTPLVFSESDILAQVPSVVVSDSYDADNTLQAPIQALLDIDGANQIWDFTTLVWLAESKTTGTTEFVVLPAGLPDENDPRVADANYAVVSSGAAAKSADDMVAAYFQTTPTQHFGFGTAGVADGEAFSLLYDSGKLENPFPLTMGSVWTGSGSYSIDQGGFTIETTNSSDGSVTGWGTLVLPTGSYPALRINRVTTISTTIGGFPGGPPTEFTNIEFITKSGVVASIIRVPDILNPGSTMLYADYVVPSTGGGGNPPADPPADPSPVDGFHFAGDPNLGWQAVPGATAYDLQISTETLGKGASAGIVIDETGIVGTNYAPAGLDPNTTYYWHVRGTNGDGPGPWSPSVSFTTAASLPEAPVLNSPASASAGVTTAPVLIWTATDGADTYDVQVAEDITFTTLHDDLTGIAGTQVTVGPLLNSTAYYWRVRGVNGQGAGEWSEIRSFTTINLVLPNIVILTSPADAAQVGSLSPDLVWVTGVDTDTYDVQVATDQAFANVVTDLTGLAVTTVNSGTAAIGVYYWRVRGVNGNGPGEWSETRSYEVQSSVAVEGLDGAIPTTFELYQNYPNPFNPTTTIRFSIPQAADVRLSVFDTLGREVAILANRSFGPGQYQYNWDAAGMESGIYLYRMLSGDVTRTGTMILLK